MVATYHRDESRAAYTGSTQSSGTIGFKHGKIYDVKDPQTATAMPQREFQRSPAPYYDDSDHDDRPVPVARSRAPDKSQRKFERRPERYCDDNGYDHGAVPRTKAPPPPRADLHSVMETPEEEVQARLKNRIDSTKRSNHRMPQSNAYDPSMYAQSYGRGYVPPQGGPCCGPCCHPAYYSQPCGPMAPMNNPYAYAHAYQGPFPPPSQYFQPHGPAWQPNAPGNGPSRQ